MRVLIGDLFESSAKTLVNTVNCVGVMGKGVALEFKKRFPDMYDEYVSMCKNGSVKPGVPYYYQDLYGASVVNFPTKDHWRSPSRLSYILDGLEWIKNNYQQYGITSIAFPPLGCGNGGLSWDVVGPVMYSALKDLPIDVEIYAPYGTSPEKLTARFLSNGTASLGKEMSCGKKIPFNKYWLLILYVVKKLNNDRYSLNVGRTIFQKVCFVLDRVGLPMGFHFVEGIYGPYAKEVNDAVTALSNANFMTERQLGSMVETVVSPSFVVPYDEFTRDELRMADQAFDLMSRIKSTEQAEMIATVLFSYDELSERACPTEQEVYDHVMKWKRRWKGEMDQEVILAICDLSSLGWIRPKQGSGLLMDDDLF